MGKNIDIVLKEKKLGSIPEREQVDFLYFAQQNLRTEKGAKLDFEENFKYLKDIYDSRVKKIVIKKASQMGISTFAINKILWLTSNFIITCIYTMPSGGDVSEFSQTRFNSAIKYSDIKIPINIDNVGVKQIGNSFVYFRGTWTERQAISVPSDFNIHDEIDFSKPGIVEMYNERLSASFLKWKLLISTPSIPNYGISAEFETTDKREWFVKCKKCGYEQVLSEENIIDEEFRCLKCKEILDRSNGVWRATKESENLDVGGYHISQLMAPWISAKEILKKKEDAELKRLYYNFVLGEEYAGGEEIVTRADIISCIVNEPVPPPENKTVIGVDWGDISWVVVRRGEYIIYLEKIEGDTRQHPIRVLELMEKFNAYAVVDFGYGDIKNKILIEKHPGKVWQCVYSDKVLYPDFNNNTRIVKIDRNLSLSESFEEIKNKKIKILSNPLINEFIRHYSNMVKQKEMGKNGEVREVYVRTGDDHFCHSYNYARLLFVKNNQGGEVKIRWI